jgi:hypothetical protein
MQFYKKYCLIANFWRVLWWIGLEEQSKIPPNELAYFYQKTGCISLSQKFHGFFFSKLLCNFKVIFGYLNKPPNFRDSLSHARFQAFYDYECFDIFGVRDLITEPI